jgi:general secretion pathway protein C
MAISNAQIRRIGLAGCVVMSGFLIAHAINAFVADALYLPPDRHFTSPAGEAALSMSYSPSQAAEEIRASGLFPLPSMPQGITSPGGPAGVPVRASIGAAGKIRLIGVVFGDHRGVFAIVEELSSKKQSLYRLHERIPDVGEVSEIHRDGMVVRLGDQEELLELAVGDKPAGPIAAPGAPPAQAGTPLRKVIDRREVEQAMNDLPKLLSQARAVPNMVNGALSGFRIDYIAPTSFYEKIGIQSGDVLQRVNGVDIRDPTTMLNLFQQLKNERVVKLDMVRNNQPSTVTYELR